VLLATNALLWVFTLISYFVWRAADTPEAQDAAFSIFLGLLMLAGMLTLWIYFP
jgi:hypothetical protein